MFQSLWKVLFWYPSAFTWHYFRMFRLPHKSHYNDVIMSMIASQITSLAFVYSTVYFGADQRKHQSSASLAFVRGIHRGPVNSPHKWPVTRKMFPFDDVIMTCYFQYYIMFPVTEIFSDKINRMVPFIFMMEFLHWEGFKLISPTQINLGSYWLNLIKYHREMLAC